MLAVFDSCRNLFGQRLGRVDAVFAAHVAMRHQANRIRPKRAHQHAARLQPRRKLARALPRRQPEDHDVGLHRRRDRSPRPRCAPAPRPATARWRDPRRAASALLRAQSVPPPPARPPAACRRPMLCGRRAPAPSVPPNPPASIPPARPVPSTGRTSPCRSRASAPSRPRPAPRPR